MTGRPKGSVQYRPADYVDDLCAWLESGRTLSDWSRREGNPTARLVYEWMDADREIFSRIARARETGHDTIADDCLKIADEPPPSDENGKTDSGFVQWQKNRIWTRTQLLAKWNPKKYGDRVDLKHSGSVGLQINIAVDDPE
jgi:hypothetical protein